MPGGYPIGKGVIRREKGVTHLGGGEGFQEHGTFFLGSETRIF